MTGQPGSELYLTALIPAAGLSRRMGQPKLLMPVAGRPVIDHVLDSLRHPAIDGVAVLVRPDDADLQQHLSGKGHVRLVVPDSPPPDMRASVQSLLAELQSEHFGGWLLIPGDSPWIDPDVLAALISVWQANPDRVVVPTFQGHRGHPTLFPPSLMTEVPQIPPDHGLNFLLRSDPGRVLEVNCHSESVLFDLDTPDDVARLATAWTWRGRL